MSTKLITKQDGLYLEMEGLPAAKVIEGFESFNGWYWFATEISEEVVKTPSGEEKVIEHKQGNTEHYKLQPGEKLIERIYFGYVQGDFPEWGSFALSELSELMKSWKVWRINKQDLPSAGVRD